MPNQPFSTYLWKAVCANSASQIINLCVKLLSFSTAWESERSILNKTFNHSPSWKLYSVHCIDIETRRVNCCDCTVTIKIKHAMLLWSKSQNPVHNIFFIRRFWLFIKSSSKNFSLLFRASALLWAKHSGTWNRFLCSLHGAWNYLVRKSVSSQETLLSGKCTWSLGSPSLLPNLGKFNSLWDNSYRIIKITPIIIILMMYLLLL